MFGWIKKWLNKQHNDQEQTSLEPMPVFTVDEWKRMLYNGETINGYRYQPLKTTTNANQIEK